MSTLAVEKLENTVRYKNGVDVGKNFIITFKIKN